ncbi:MAG: Rpn family recombination-promoting nuclease/putative transposase [Treponema sp.]|nr:Rpn family recombination-promoting nuclease/putative transposase [Treponema sp.]
MEKRERRDYHRKTVDELTFTDDGMFQAVLHEPGICAELVERLLHIKVNHIEYPELEKTIAPFYSSKGVRLDVYLKDTDKVIDVELQSYPLDEPGKRTRYYNSMVDIDCLMKGHDYSELKDCYILFICKKDPFKDENDMGYGLPCYTFMNMCKENSLINLNDKTVKVFYNASMYEKEKNESVRAFLHFVHTNDSGKDEFTNRLSEIVEKLKNNERFRSQYLAMNLHDRDLIRWAKKEGASQKAIEDAENLLRLNVLSYEQISQSIGLPLEKVQEIAEKITEKSYLHIS